MKNTYQSELDALRKQVNSLDALLSKTLSKRIQISKEIGELKKKHNIREMSVSRQVDIFKNISLPEKDSDNLIKKIYSLIFKHSIKVQQLIINRK